MFSNKLILIAIMLLIAGSALAQTRFFIIIKGPGVVGPGVRVVDTGDIRIASSLDTRVTNTGDVRVTDTGDTRAFGVVNTRITQ